MIGQICETRAADRVLPSRCLIPIGLGGRFPLGKAAYLLPFCAYRNSSFRTIQIAPC
jgi:hypothetical protein